MPESMFSLTGKTALVTGASRGIGRAITIGYAQAGANVVLAARSAEALGDVAAEAKQYGVKALTVPCDLLRPGAPEHAFQQALDAFGDIDILVNNAGMLGSVGPFLELTDDDWARITRVNFEAPLRLLRLFGRHATARGSGTAINMSSVAGLNGVPMIAHYASLKSALISLSKTLAAEWAKSGVRVNALAPGWISTELTTLFAADPTVAEGLLHAVPDKRWGAPSDVVSAAVWLASDSARMVTGACLVIDGGMSAYNGGPTMLDVLALGRLDAP